jgi:hypothetical protein
LFAGSYDKGIFMSVNGGESWIEFNDGLSTKEISALAIDPKEPDCLYAGTRYGGIFTICRW